ncbi:TIGR03013 family XrtA/PEP-CTERM system glycosyltransferase [Candidatus Nitrosacidococcus tergens]|uniref:Sugar transferase, PEP-CTERM system associated n=1 Tax=Candidatus Nitrosacidococcus tergens TaxID=553981 RepID=A0A7G1QBK5_9GAMM|nr:TIGR03013 family XrtA/PEP-CTERM system glycosyltransferase [Candidatus Nitrosacidococcus tergens]CAB1276793.1 Sugar transferase, PEP-CTERM system associated [Candidatus Nitrosacidococcus tergens]
MSIRFFNHYVRASFLLLAFFEVTILLPSIWLTIYTIFLGWSDLPKESIEAIWINAGIYVLIVTASLVIAGLYRRRQSQERIDILYHVAAAIFLATLGLGIVFYFIPDLYLGKRIFTADIITTFFALLSIRFTFSYLLSLESLQRKLLIFGAGKRAKTLENMHDNFKQLGIHIIGYIPMSDEPILVANENLVEINISNLQKYVIQKNVDEIIIATNECRDDLPFDALLSCRLLGIEVIDILDFFERTTSKIKIDIMDPRWLLLATGFKGYFLRQIGKRTFDIAISIILVILCAPLLIFATIAILLESGRPILYYQNRVGEGNKIFRIWKFRTMYQNAESDGKARWAASNDSRITPIGWWLRRTRIDELPQIFNIIQGKMSFVGPRPERPEFVETLAKKIPYYNQRHRIKPGLAGWAQISYPYGSTEEDALKKLEYDLYYVKNYGFFFDLMILLQTAEVVVTGKGVR